jgi:threonine/homoserine/homoserine lactone efflux protein
MTLVVAAGVGALVAGSTTALTGLTVVGGGYLVWHGLTTFAKPSRLVVVVDGAARTGREILVRGVGVSGLNPKGLLLFVALLPQFTDRHGSWPVAVQLALLGAVFTVSCAVFYAGLGQVARTVLRARPTAAGAVARLAGAAMAVIGVLLIVDRLAT